MRVNPLSIQVARRGVHHPGIRKFGYFRGVGGVRSDVPGSRVERMCFALVDVCLAGAEDAIELGELLELVGDCLDAVPEAFADVSA